MSQKEAKKKEVIADSWVVYLRKQIVNDASNKDKVCVVIYSFLAAYRRSICWCGDVFIACIAESSGCGT